MMEKRKEEENNEIDEVEVEEDMDKWWMMEISALFIRHHFEHHCIRRCWESG